MWVMELKALKGRFSPEQIMWQNILKEHNALYGAVRSFEEIDNFLNLVHFHNSRSDI